MILFDIVYTGIAVKENMKNIYLILWVATSFKRTTEKFASLIKFNIRILSLVKYTVEKSLSKDHELCETSKLSGTVVITHN